MSTTEHPSVPFHPEGTPYAGYPFFVQNDDNKDSWDKLTPERQQDYLEAVPYIQEKFSGEKITIGMVGTILAVGG